MQKKILIVDDEPDILDILEYNLVRYGYEIEKAKNGEEAIELANSFLPDLILLDIMMPQKDGISVCRELRKNDIFSKTFIILLTARADEFYEIAGFDAGADDFVVKPIRPKSLISRINSTLLKDRHIKNSDDIRIFGGLRIDNVKRKISINGINIKLTKKEFEILLVLSSEPERVFTRSYIYKQVWGNNIIVGDRTLDVHIQKLRKKIGKKYIETMKGMGFSFHI